MNFPIIIIIWSAIGFLIGYFLRQIILQRKADSLEAQIKARLQKAKNQEKEIILSAKEKAVEILHSAEKKQTELLNSLKEKETRLLNKEAFLEKKEIELENTKKQVNQLKEELTQKIKETEALKEQAQQELQKIAKLSEEEAKKLLFEEIEKNSQKELLESVKKLELYRKEELEKKSREIILSAIQRQARSVTSEFTTRIVSLPSEEMKGRIIGKEGRNIKFFEQLTGVEILIDETPEVVTLSCFDPVRRETAALTLERLIKDGRINPARIQEEWEKARKDIQDEIKKAGEEAVYELEIFDLPPQIIYLLGRLKFRTSYGQNVLDHSIEVAYLAKFMAEELNLDKEVAKKAGLLHDIGKSVDHEIEGSHLEIGIRILQKYGIDEKIILAMKSHHETYPFAIPEAYLILASDAISASRPGARSESAEEYLKRLEELERIALQFEGIEKAYAVAGGREIWVFVIPEEVNDYQLFKLAKEIANQIEKELKYPGEIKVVTIRETKAVEYAK